MTGSTVRDTMAVGDVIADDVALADRFSWCSPRAGVWQRPTVVSVEAECLIALVSMSGLIDVELCTPQHSSIGRFQHLVKCQRFWLWQS